MDDDFNGRRTFLDLFIHFFGINRVLPLILKVISKCWREFSNNSLIMGSNFHKSKNTYFHLLAISTQISIQKTNNFFPSFHLQVSFTSQSNWIHSVCTPPFRKLVIIAHVILIAIHYVLIAKCPELNHFSTTNKIGANNLCVWKISEKIRMNYDFVQ